MNQGIPDRIIELIIKHRMGELPADEKIELDQWLDNSEENRWYFSRIEDRKGLGEKWKIYNESDGQEVWRRLSEDIPEINLNIAARSRAYKWRRLSIAAAVLIIVSATGWYFLKGATSEPNEGKVAIVNTKTDIAPGGNKALLTLADGTNIVLDNAQNGSLAKQGSTAILKQQDQVTYKLGPVASTKELLYNTISTPRGGQFHIILPDGTNVWLNAASAIRFPTQFTGNERKVEISGEAYFEVATLRLRSGQKIPFKVSFGDQGEIEVLGTHFNVNAYADENYINTTLLEGSIRLTLNAKNKISESKILSPGQQALLNKDANKLSITKNEEAESAVAWVKGIFHFEDADIKTVMRQLSRWYNVDVTYEGTIPNKKIMGDAERNIPLSKMLMRLEKMTSVHLVLEGRTIKVTQ